MAVSVTMANINFRFGGIEYSRTGLSGAGVVVAAILVFPVLIAIALALRMLAVFVALWALLHVWPGLVDLTFANVFWASIASLFLLPPSMKKSSD